MPNVYQVEDIVKINLLEDEEGPNLNKLGTKIIDLNTDCLEIIFGHLEFNELLNVADSSKQFYSATCQVYRRKFQNINPIFGLKEYPFG